MNTLPFASLVGWILHYGYPLIFLAMMTEGPIVTTAAAFAAGAGFFDIKIIYLLSIFGDISADIIYYGIGYWGRSAILEKYGHYVGLTSQRIERVQKLLHKHVWKTLIAIKLTPGLALAGLATVGMSKLPLKKYAVISAAITIPKSLLFVVLGFYFGRLHEITTAYFRVGIYALPMAFLVILLISFVYQKISAKLAVKIEKI